MLRAVIPDPAPVKVVAVTVKEIKLETDKLLVVMNGIVRVSKKNVVPMVFALMDPVTFNVSVTDTFAVVTAFEA